MKVLVSDKLSQLGIDKLKEAGLEVDVKTGLPADELIKIIPEYDALIIRSETKVIPAVIEASKKLKIIARAGVGIDNVDLLAATQKGIIVVNSPAGNTVAAAEHTMAMMLSLCRNIPKAEVSFRAGKWERSKLVGTELYQKTLGIIGLGKIGSQVASYARSFGMQLIAYDPFASLEYAEKIGVTLKKLDEVLSEADILTLHLPKTKETLHMINKDKFALMKKGVRIINCARGGVIDEADLAEALKSGQVAGAAVDVFEKEPPEPNNPLFEAPNTVLAPHLGASTVEAQENVAIDVVEQVIDVLVKGNPARSAVNIPAMRPEIMMAAKPYMGLAEKIGKLIGQLIDGAPQKVDIFYAGEVAGLDVSPLSVVVLKGLLEPSLQDSVNIVNAPLIAKERDIKVSETKNSAARGFANFIEVKVKTHKETRSVGGALMGSYGERIVRIDEFAVDVAPAGFLLVASHTDQPGIVGKVGTILGDNKINIANMDVGRETAGGKAVMVLTVDSDISADLIEKIAKSANLNRVHLVKI